VTSELNDDQSKFWMKVPIDGQTISNRALQEALGWDSDRYYEVRDSLVDAGFIIRGRGRGGTIRRQVIPATIDNAAPTIAQVPEEARKIEEVISSELSLYGPMREVIRGDWAKDHRAYPIAVEVTAQQGRRATGGTWSRPDIVSVEIRTFSYVPGKYLEVVTFEVKPVRAIGVQAVYEALAHRRAATHSYVLLHVPAEEAVALESLIEDVIELARSHGIGVVTAADPADYETWDERVEAARFEPDPERLDEFISTQLSEGACRLIAQRLR